MIKSYEVCRAHVKDRKHLEAYETLWINRTKGCCNIRPPIQYLKKVREKEYYQANKTEINEKQKEYYEANKEKKKEYREANETEITAYKKEWFQEHKVEIMEKRQKKATCECGCVVLEHNLQEHKKTKKHINRMASTNFKPQVTCECGCVVTKSSLSRHRKTKKHIEFMDSK